jgi:uncharacterized protein YbjT (DUF2867 family)
MVRLLKNQEEEHMSEKVLIIGATGKVGSELVKLFIRDGRNFRAATRNPATLTKILPASAEVIEFDYERPRTFVPAITGIDKIFLVARPGDNHSDKAAAPFIDEAKKAGVRLIVNLTAMGVEQDDSFMLRVLEKYVEDSGISYTHLRPNWFMQNFSSMPMLVEMKASRSLCLPAADAKISFIDVRDIAAVAFEALIDARHANKAYTLTGAEALSHFQVTEKLSVASGKIITYAPISEEMARSGLAKNGFPPELIERWTDFHRKIRQGLCSPVSSNVDLILGRSPISFDQYAADYAQTWI